MAKKTLEQNEKSTADVPAVGFEKEAAEVFKSYPDAKVLYFTSDGLSFLKREDAESNAKRLRNLEIVTINKD
jgi:hypothetical protein